MSSRDHDELRRFHVVLSTADDAVRECDVDALDAVMAAVIARARYAPGGCVTRLHVLRAAADD